MKENLGFQGWLQQDDAGEGYAVADEDGEAEVLEAEEWKGWRDPNKIRI